MFLSLLANLDDLCSGDATMVMIGVLVPFFCIDGCIPLFFDKECMLL